jgi:3-oxoadipate enol-lactonase
MQATVGGRSLHYEVLGSGSPVLLVHGFPFTSELWDPIVPALEREYRLIVPDLRGHGRSQASATVTMAGYVEDLATLLDRIGEARPVVLVGMSMGGYIAFEFCRRHPERLRALVLANTRAQADNPEGLRARRELARRAEREGSGAVAESMLPRLFGPRASPQLRDRWRRIMATADPVGIVAALGAMAERPDSFSTLAALTCPVLIVAGDEDALTPLEGARQMQRAAPHSRLEVIPRSGHMSPVENPERFLEVLRRFLEEIRSPDDV